jgi:hypothetical protein
LHAEAIEITRDLISNGALPEDLIVGARAFAVSNQSEDALELLDVFSKRRREPWLAGAGVELIDSLPPEVDPVRREAIRNRFIRRRGPAKGSADNR